MGIPEGLPSPPPPILLPLGLAKANVDHVANRHHDSWTGTKAILKPSRKPAWARLASPILHPVLSGPSTELSIQLFDLRFSEPLPGD
jgi:hypothetical protein